MTRTVMELTCHVCNTPEALTCKIVVVGEGLWVSLLRQQCTCDVYRAWNHVWQEARTAVRKNEQLRTQPIC